MNKKSPFIFERAHHRFDEIYDPATDTWSAAPDMPSARQDLGAVSLNGILYTMGGWDPAASPEMLDVVEAFDPIRKTWTTLAPMPTRRSGMGVGVLHGLLIVIGGGDSKTVFPTVEAFDPVRGRWSTLENMATARNFFAVVAMNETLYGIGGRATNRIPSALTENDAFNLIPCANRQEDPAGSYE